MPADGLGALTYEQTSNRINKQIGQDGYLYDLAGNLVKGQDAAGDWQWYDYDTAGRLQRVWNNARNVVQQDNAYGASRRRETTWYSGSIITYYQWSGGAVIAEYDALFTDNALTWKRAYIYAGGESLLATYTKNGGGEDLEFHHPDRLGTRLVTNPQANTSFEQNTLPFGTALGGESTGSTSRRFTSYERSTSASLDYAVNRSYSPAQGRFTQVDPIGMSAASLTNPQSLNMYSYCENDPINNTDPDGLFWGFTKKLFKLGGCNKFCVSIFSPSISSSS